MNFFDSVHNCTVHCSLSYKKYSMCQKQLMDRGKIHQENESLSLSQFDIPLIANFAGPLPSLSSLSLPPPPPLVLRVAMLS